MNTDVLITVGVFAGAGLVLLSMLWMQYRFVFQSGWVRIVIFGSSETHLMRRLRMDRDFSAKNSDGEMMKYEIDERHQIRGKWNVPTQYYWLDHTEPIQIKNVNRRPPPVLKVGDDGEPIIVDGQRQYEPVVDWEYDEGDVVAWDGPRAVELEERTESHVASDAINAFRAGGITAQQGIMMVLITVMLVGAGLWYSNGQAFDEIKFRLDAQSNRNTVQPIATPIGGINPTNPGTGR